MLHICTKSNCPQRIRWQPTGKNRGYDGYKICGQCAKGFYTGGASKANRLKSKWVLALFSAILVAALVWGVIMKRDRNEIATPPLKLEGSYSCFSCESSPCFNKLLKILSVSDDVMSWEIPGLGKSGSNLEGKIEKSNSATYLILVTKSLTANSINRFEVVFDSGRISLVHQADGKCVFKSMSRQ